MRKFISLISIIVALSGCAGPNPNPGERITDIGWLTGSYDRAFVLAKDKAEMGEPWAQLRLAIFYHNGWGVDKNFGEALRWYGKAEQQTAEGGWADGVVLGAFGKSGYFGQNNDALIARYNLAGMYFRGEGVEKNLDKALSLIESVIENSKGMPVYFCCNFTDEPRFFTQAMFESLKLSIEKEQAINSNLSHE